MKARAPVNMQAKRARISDCAERVRRARYWGTKKKTCMQIKAGTRQTATARQADRQRTADLWPRNLAKCRKMEKKLAQVAAKAENPRARLRTHLQSHLQVSAFLPPAALVYGRDLLATNFGFSCGFSSFFPAAKAETCASRQQQQQPHGEKKCSKYRVKWSKHT